ncbi:MAG TPA: L,D-transpeptidase family protein [Caulobacteraceae bacterium]|nr:L,D-transpeptidase family protein [Caulobacteraceae bacterium]
MTTLAAPSRRLTRRQSLSLAAWAVLGASCNAQTPARGSVPPDAVGAGLSDPLARRFYQQRGWRAAWDPGSIRELIRGIADARRHGLDPAAFAPKRDADPTPARQDENLTAAALAYAKALSEGFVEPRRIEKIYTVGRNSVDLPTGLQQALAQRKLGDWLASLPPSSAEYETLSAAYLNALGRSGLSSPPASGAPVGTSMAPPDQARQLAANLERRRWLARSPAAHRIDVNTAGAFLNYVEPGAQNLALRTVVGRDDHPTPSIEAPFHRLIANPPWIVPEDIARREILPKGAAYLRRQEMGWVGGKLEQRPGPECALGLVKFDLEDPYDIYLHDTSAKQLFQEPERHRSHGCVRVENALDLARRIAGEVGKGDAFDEALASRDTREVGLGEAIPVRMLYHTAYLDAGGGVILAPDVYGWDDALAAALGLGQAAAARRREPEILFGP